MITRFHKITDFGVFPSFQWDTAVSDFLRYNVIYGWNYSGKTTLSRALRSFELRCVHPDYPSSQSYLQTSDGRTHGIDSEEFSTPIRVFNEDSVKENIRWDEALEPIFMLGEENIQLQEELSKKREELSRIRDEAGTLEKEARDLRDNIETRLKDKARIIKNTLPLPDFNRTKLKQFVQSSESNKDHPLSVQELQKYLMQYRATDRRDKLSLIHIHYADLNGIVQRIEPLLTMTVKSTVIEKLQNDPVLNSWVRKGKELHTDKTHCEFCGSRLPDGLMEKLGEHFSDHYEAHIKALDSAIEEIQAFHLKSSIPSGGELYNDLVNEFSIHRDRVTKSITSYNSYLDILVGVLQRKKTNPFQSVKLPSKPESLQLDQEIDRLNDVIGSHNRRTDGFEKGKAKALQELLRHFAAEFAKEANYGETKRRIDDYNSKAELKRDNEKILSQECIDIEQRLSETVRGAESVNKYLEGFFNKRDLKIKSTMDNKFEVIRSGHKAKNLSQGERTAISFAYFMAKLHERDLDLSKTIVFLDDPISSLDANHLFNTYSLIRIELSVCKQLFISTHSFEFLNLLKDWFGEKPFKNNTEYYLLELQENDSGSTACIINMPSLLRNFKSEYHYLFSILYSFIKYPTENHDLLYLLPNISRRFLEAFLGVKVPRHIGLKSKLKKAMPDDIERHKLIKFMDQYSHNTSLLRTLYYPDLSECKSVISTILERIREMDNEHYKAMVEEVESQTAAISD